MNSIWQSSPAFLSKTAYLKKNSEMMGVVMSAGKNNKTCKVLRNNAG